MNARATIVLFLVLSLALVPVLVASPVKAQGQYSERLDVYTAGPDAYWVMTLNKLNSSIPALTSAESGATGVTGYKLVALSTQAEVSNYQVFGNDGYNVLGLPYVPAQGLFLYVNASSSSAGASLLSYFSSRFATSFSQVSSSGGTTVYFAPVSFGSIAAPILYRMVPTSQGGFANFTAESSFLGLPMPVIELTGSYNGTAFNHSIAIGAATASILGSGNIVNLSELVGSANATLTASKNSGSSEVVIHSLDGIVVSKDASATVSNNMASFSGTYSVNVAAGKNAVVNASIEQQPPTVVAYRLLDHGSLNLNGTVSVTVVVSNTASSGTIYNVTGNDDWFVNDSSLFQLTASGNHTFDIASIAAGHNANVSYALTLVTNSSKQFTIPPLSVSYSYDLSTTSVTRTVTTGENTLQLNGVGPALMVTAKPSVSSGAAIGTAAGYTVIVTNTGNSPAYSLKLDNYTDASLAQDGGSYTFTLPVSASNLRQTNFSRAFSLEYSNSAGQTQNLTVNSVSLVLSHTAMVIPFISVATTDSITTAALSAHMLNVTYTFTNEGKGNSSGVSATEVFPSGIQCQVPKGNGMCNGDTLTVGIPVLNTTEVTTVELNFTKDNFIVPPTNVTADYAGLKLSTFGAAYVIPAGLSVAKAFNPNFGFPGTKSQVTVTVTNVGTSQVFNATVSSDGDPFDGSPTGTTQQTYPVIAPNQAESFNYTVTLDNTVLGNVSSGPVSTSFIFAGSSQELSIGSSYVTILSPVKALVTSNTAAPEENHDFTVAVTISNPADVNVTNIVYSLDLPTGLSVVSGGSVSNHVVTITVPTLAPDSNSTVSLTFAANTGLTLDTSNSHLTFQYLGNTLSGTVPSLKVVVGVDVTTRYILPIIIAVFVALAAIVFVRRRVGTVASA